jgi:hypothetical protein
MVDRSGSAVGNADQSNPHIWHVYYPGQPPAPEPPAEQPSSHADLKALAKELAGTSADIEYTPEEQLVNERSINAGKRASHPGYR